MHEEKLTERGYLPTAKQIIIVWISFAITKKSIFKRRSFKMRKYQAHAENMIGGRRGDCVLEPVLVCA